MTATKRKWTKLYEAAALCAVCALAVSAFLFLYEYDNKYTADCPPGNSGVLVLENNALSRYPVVFLTEGLEYYDGRLLTPQDFTGAAQTPDAYIYIGQYGGFDAGDITASPHGSASYRLTIELPELPGQYLLELPEIFSAYRAYVNGKLVQTMGDPDPASYRPETGNRTVNIEAGGQAELLIAVSDFSHIYSGLTYPPAFGIPEAVEGLLSARLIIRSLPVAFALAVGLLSLFIGFAGGRQSLAILYGGLCVAFVGYTSYPIVKTLTSAFYPYYTIEQFSFCAMLAVVMLLERSIFSRHQKRDWVIIGFGVFMCAASLILPFLLPGGNLIIMVVYSWLVTAYEWLTAIFLTITAVRALILENVHSKTLLGGILILDIALILDRTLPLHEPIVSGWFHEIASFALVLGIGIVVAREVAAKYRDSAVMSERMNSLERLSGMQQKNYELLRESVEETRTIRHDFRHHIIAIEGFLLNREYDRLGTYIRKFSDAVSADSPLGFSQNSVVNILVSHYSRLAEKAGVNLTRHLDISEDVKVSEADLCAILSNLMENALESCARQETGERFVALSIGQKPSMLAIRMENSMAGNVTGSSGVFLSSKARGRKGYGLDSIRAIAGRYYGEADFQADHERNVFISTVILML